MGLISFLVAVVSRLYRTQIRHQVLVISKLMLMAIGFSFSSGGLHAQSIELSIHFDEVTSSALSAQREAIIDSAIADGVEEVLQDELELEQDLSLRFVSEAEPDKYLVFDEEKSEIRLAYQMRAAIIDRLSRKHPELKASSLQKQADAVLEMALYHQLAHALSSNFGLSEIGQETALNQLAVLLLLEGHEAETRINITALKRFGLIAIDYDSDGDDYWKSHGLNFELFSKGICIIVGSAPDRYELAADRVGFNDNKIDNCVDDYGLALANWLDNLYDYLKKGGNFIRL